MPESFRTTVTAVAVLKRAGLYSSSVGTLRFVIRCRVVPTPKASACWAAELSAAARSVGWSLLLRGAGMWLLLLRCGKAEHATSWSMCQAETEIKGC